MRRSRSSLVPLFTLLSTFLTIASASRAAVLTLAPAGTSQGFTLTTFVFNAPQVSSVGPLGVALRTDGQVLVTTATGTIVRFPNHASMQNWNGGTLVSSRGQSNAQCIAQIQQNNVWKYYLTQDPLGRIVEIDQDGQDVVPSHVIALPGALCLVPYPPGIVNTHTGHLFATREGSNNIFEIDPVANSVSTFKVGAGNAVDGLTFSPDGSILYVACYNDLVVRGFSVATGATVFTSPVTSPASHPDGTAIGTGTLTGYVFANCNEGVVWEFGLPGTPHAGEVNLIAQSGTRGDFIASDTDIYCGSSGSPSLLLSQTDRMVRLDPPGGGFFGPPASISAPVGPGSAAPPPGPGDPPPFGATSAPAMSPIGVFVSAILLAGAGLSVLRRSSSRNAA